MGGGDPEDDLGRGRRRERDDRVRGVLEDDDAQDLEPRPQGRDLEGLPALRRRRDWKDILQEPEAGGEGAGGEDDGRGAAGDDRRSRSRWRRGGERGRVPPHHEEDQPVLSRSLRPSEYTLLALQSKRC